MWQRMLEVIGSVIEPEAHSGGLVRHRVNKALAPLFTFPVSLRVDAYKKSVLTSATWLSWCWTLSQEQVDSFLSWNGRSLRQMLRLRRSPERLFPGPLE